MYWCRAILGVLMMTVYHEPCELLLNPGLDHAMRPNFYPVLVNPLKAIRMGMTLIKSNTLNKM